MSNIIEWSDSYSVGVSLIDSQHKHFIGILNDLYTCLQAGDSQKLPVVIKDLVTYTSVHFDTEERYFDEFKYDGAEEHTAVHEELKLKVLAFSRKRGDPIATGYELLDFLEDWLINHLGQMDKKYTRCFNQHGLK